MQKKEFPELKLQHQISFLPKRPVCSWCQQVSFQGQIWSHSPPVQCSSVEWRKSSSSMRKNLDNHKFTISVKLKHQLVQYQCTMTTLTGILHLVRMQATGLVNYQTSSYDNLLVVNTVGWKCLLYEQCLIVKQHSFSNTMLDETVWSYILQRLIMFHAKI